MKKPIILFGVLIAIFVGLYLLSPVQIYKQITLKTFYSKLTNAIKTNDCATIYSLRSDNFKSSTSLEKYNAECQGYSAPYSSSYTVYSYDVEGNVGYIDRLYVACKTSDCTGQNRHEDRVKKKYLFINGRWGIPDDDGTSNGNSILCSRNTPYANPPEFSRAISLVIQRIHDKGGTGNTNFANQLSSIQNCLNINYANNVNQLENAEGVFKLSTTSTNDDLGILVSPDYQSKDDLLTAILLSHEASHALFFANGEANSLSCFENEAWAFTNEWVFYTTLNAEEQKSLTSRLYESEKVTATLLQFIAINKLQGATYHDKALNYVKNNPYYQKQCQNSK